MSSHIDVQRKSGITPSLYNCTVAIRKPDLCTMRNSITDKKLICFLFRYLSNLFEARQTAGTISSPQELQDFLLTGPELKNVSAIAGIDEIYAAMRSAVPSDEANYDGATISTANTESASLRAQIAIKERAVKRLESLFLYAEDAMSEADYVNKKNSLIREISVLKEKLETMANTSTVDFYAFLKNAGNLANLMEFSAEKTIDYQSVILRTGAHELHDFFRDFFRFIEIDRDKITAIQFNNGIRHDFVYE